VTPRRPARQIHLDAAEAAQLDALRAALARCGIVTDSPTHALRLVLAADLDAVAAVVAPR
jgi:hypothetical protein